MKPRQAAACAHCGSPGKSYQLNDLLRFDKEEPMVVLCVCCIRSLKYADAKTWKWFRDYRARLISSREKQTQGRDLRRCLNPILIPSRRPFASIDAAMFRRVGLEGVSNWRR
jgi:hypothetical protein